MKQFDSWTDGLTSEMAQAMLSGCVVVGVIPDVKRGESSFSSRQLSITLTHHVVRPPTHK